MKKNKTHQLLLPAPQVRLLLPAPKKNFRPKRKTKHYLDKKILYDELIRFHANGAVNVHEKLQLMFFKMASNIINRTRFARCPKIQKDDMVMEAYLKCVSVVHKFDMYRENANPFSYFTSVINNSMKDYTKFEEKHHNFKNQLKEYIDIL